jgi:high mobility group protein B2|tara:strand:- start:121 stop:591 length:471 start_codon:yes stop_codon:yes gene_type:complete
MVRKSKRRKRDPARPKRAMTPFLYFACEKRKELKENGEKMTLPDQSRRIAGMWKIVEDKSSYETSAAVDRARYEQEMKSYVPPKKIKRPRSSYAFFMKAVRGRIADAAPSKTPRELMSDIAAAWRQISDEEKNRYTQMATDDKKRYQEEKNAESSI